MPVAHVVVQYFAPYVVRLLTLTLFFILLHSQYHQYVMFR